MVWRPCFSGRLVAGQLQQAIRRGCLGFQRICMVGYGPSEEQQKELQRGGVQRPCGHAGTTLMADVYRPDAPGRFPTIVTRTAYDKSRTDSSTMTSAATGWRSAVTCTWPLRGTPRRVSSAPALSARTTSTQDGYDRVGGRPAVVRRQGRHLGSSYDGWTQWALAHTRPPHLLAMMPRPDASTRDQLGGVQAQAVLGHLEPSPPTRGRATGSSGARRPGRSKTQWIERDLYKWLWYRPWRSPTT